MIYRDLIGDSQEVCVAVSVSLVSGEGRASCGPGFRASAGFSSGDMRRGVVRCSARGGGRGCGVAVADLHYLRGKGPADRGTAQREESASGGAAAWALSGGCAVSRSRCGTGWRAAAGSVASWRRSPNAVMSCSGRSTTGCGFPFPAAEGGFVVLADQRIVLEKPGAGPVTIAGEHAVFAPMPGNERNFSDSAQPLRYHTAA